MESPTSIENGPQPAVCRKAPTNDSLNLPTTSALTDSQRELEIRRLGQQMEAAMNQATDAGSEYFAFRGEADRCRREMERLINSRPAEYVRKLEQERGLV